MKKKEAIKLFNDLANVADYIDFEASQVKVDGVEYDPAQLAYGISAGLSFAGFALESVYLTTGNVNDKYETILRAAVEMLSKREVVKDA